MKKSSKKPKKRKTDKRWVKVGPGKWEYLGPNDKKLESMIKEFNRK